MKHFSSLFAFQATETKKLVFRDIDRHVAKLAINGVLAGNCI